MDNPQAVAVASTAVLIAIYAIRWYTDPLRAIPTVGGPSLPIWSYLGALRTLKDCKGVLEEGYKKYPCSAFKVPMLDRWVVIVPVGNAVEGTGKRVQEQLSRQSGAEEVLHFKYIFDPLVLSDKHHVSIVRDKFSRGLPAILPDLVDEVAVAVKRHLPNTENEWTSVEVMPAIQKVTIQTSNRALVGLPLCRNEAYLDLADHFFNHLSNCIIVLQFVPGFLKPIIAPFINKVKHDTSHALSYLLPIMEERKKDIAELGEGWDNKPNDVLQCVLETAISKGESMFVVAQRLLSLNLAAAPVPTKTMAHVLYHLADHPELLQPLREEVQASIFAGGWSSDAFGNKYETLRYDGVNFPHKAVKDIVLEDGTRIPRDTLVAIVPHALHVKGNEAALPEDAATFDPFRFARMRSIEGESSKHQLTNTSTGFIYFGHGRYLCPARYFAANEMKAILAYIILNYDLKRGEFEDGSYPPDRHFGGTVLAAQQGRVLFRKWGTSG